MNAPSSPDAPLEFDPRDFRNALGSFATGVTVVTTCTEDGRQIGLTCNSFSSVSLKPPLILWSLSLYSPNLQAFLKAPCFAVNVLAADQIELSKQFARPRSDKFAGVAWRPGGHGVPLLDGTAATMECRNEARHYTGDHLILIGEVVRYEYRDVEPLVFSRGRYMGLREHS
jgi:flavin reductase (DIM6/NTAB) family NADH-FMN oxidoreductase RutF